MDEYIDRTAFVAEREAVYCADCPHRKNSKGKFVYDIGDAPCRACGIRDVLDDAEGYPAADVAPVRRGRWIDISDIDHDGKSCSSCGFNATGRLAKRCNYCPNCGADMRKEQDDA